MPRRGALVTLALALAVALAAWWLATSDGGEGRVAPLVGEAPGAEGEVVLPAVGGGEPVALVAPSADAPAALSDTDDGAVSADDPPPTGPLAIRVQHAHGVPAVGARVGLYRPTPLRFVAEGVLDEHGAWSHPGLDEPAALFVVGVTPRAERFEFDVARGEHALTLPEGAVISGRVLVDGAVPTAPFPLAFSQRGNIIYGDSLRYSQLFGADRALSLVEVRGALWGTAGDTSTRGFTTDASGGFVISGLDSDAPTWLWGPSGWALDERSRLQMPISTPAADVLLSFIGPGSRICGRVVDAAGVPQADVVVRVRETHDYRWWESDTHTGTWYVERDVNTWPRYEQRTDGSGRFCLPGGHPQRLKPAPAPDLDPGAVAERGVFELVAVREDGLRARLVTEELVLGLDHDLGDLVLEEVKQHLVHVFDDEGRPIDDALVRLDTEEGEEHVWIERTNADGLARIDRFDLDQVETLTVVARGYDTARVSLEGMRYGDPIVVTLQPAVVLTMQVTWPEGFQHTRGWTWRFEVWGPVPLFQDALLPEGADLGYENYGAMSQLRLGWAGRESLDMNSGDPEDFMMGYVSRTDSMIIEGLRPRNALRPQFSLFEAPESFGELDGVVEWVGETVTLQPGEHRTVHVDMSGLEPVR